MRKEINVNELNTLLGSDKIVEVSVSTATSHRIIHKVGIGGTLTIIYESENGE